MRLRDSLTGELQPVVPGADGVIGIYACGSTVYGRIHVGNARAFVVYQLMRRYLEWTGQPVGLSRTSPMSTTSRSSPPATRASARPSSPSR